MARMPEGVLVADHHPLTRSGIRAALERRGLRVLAEAADAEEAIAAAVARAPAACLVDASLPGGGIRAVAEIVPAVRTVAIVVTARARESELLAAIRAGAVGYLPKATAPERLADAVAGALAGEAAIPRGMVRHLAAALRADDGLPRGCVSVRGVVLSAREAEVLRGLADGEATGTIADRLGISAVTVRRHVSATVGKLGVTSRDEAIALLRSGA